MSDVLDFDALIADELGTDAEDGTAIEFTYAGRKWRTMPNIGIGSVRRLVEAERRGDNFAAVAFLSNVVDSLEWQDVVDKMPPRHAGVLVAKLLSIYGGDSGK
jgi:hypothetical protein